MDLKQFNLFQAAVQWVADEDRRKKSGRKPNGLRHLQLEWGLGRVTTEMPKNQPNLRVVCATSCCLAGNIVLTNGDRFVVPDCAPSKDVVSVVHCVTAEGEFVDIDDRAVELVGIEQVEANRLFAGGLGAERLIHRATEIARRYGHTLEVV